MKVNKGIFEMKKRITAGNVITWFFVTGLVAILVMLGLLANQLNRDNKKPFVLYFKGEEETSGLLSVSVKPSQSWRDSKTGVELTGAEYDGIIVNKTDRNIIIDEIEIRFQLSGNKIDSFWNGEYRVEGNKVFFKPDELVKLLSPHGVRTFGFVMYSKYLFSNSEVTVTARFSTRPYDYPLFYVIIFAVIFWGASLLTYTVMAVRINALEKMRKRDEDIINRTMSTFANFIDAKDEYTKGHSVRVSKYSMKLAKAIGMREEEIKKIGYIALMHDCGKIATPDAILNKPAALSIDERRIIEEHTTVGYKMLEDFTEIDGIREGVLYHHERFDGTGYPDGIKGEEIPLYARIICVADAFDAMNSDRCYRQHYTKTKILAEIRKNIGTQFDPFIAKTMMNLIENGTVATKDE